MKSRTLAIAGSIAALTLAAAPVSSFAAGTAHHPPATESRLDRSRDLSGLAHVEKSSDSSRDRVDNSGDMRDL
jgi:hypothetical protein